MGTVCRLCREPRTRADLRELTVHLYFDDEPELTDARVCTSCINYYGCWCTEHDEQKYIVIQMDEDMDEGPVIQSCCVQCAFERMVHMPAAIRNLIYSKLRFRKTPSFVAGVRKVYERLTELPACTEDRYIFLVYAFCMLYGIEPEIAEMLLIQVLDAAATP